MQLLFYFLVLLLPSSTLIAMTLTEQSPKNLDDQLFEYAQKNNVSMIFDLVRLGSSVNATNPKGEIPLHIAAQRPKDDPCFVLALLANKSSIDTQDNNGDTPLHKAARSLNQAIAINLIANKADTSIKNKDGELASDLVHRMLIIKNFNAALFAYQNASLDETKNNQLATIKSLIALSKNITTVDKSSLPFADSLLLIRQSAWAEQSTLPLIELLLENGAQLDISSAQFGTPLHIAAAHAIPDTFELLLKHINSDDQINVRDKNGNTPAHITVYNEQKSNLKQLLKRGTHINLTNNQKNTPLHVALIKQLITPSKLNEKIISHLLNHEPILSVKNEDGKTPRELIEKTESIKQIGFIQTITNKTSNYLNKSLIDRLKQLEQKQITSGKQTE